MTELPTAEERDRIENQLLGAGMMYSTLRAGGAQVEIIYDADGIATNQMLVRIPIGGPPQERGYLVTVTLPEDGDATP